MLGLLSDAHGNFHAFQRTIFVLKELGAKEFVFLGDAVGYIPSAEVVRSLKELRGLLFCIRGNHEEMLLGNSIDPKTDRVYQLSRLRTSMRNEDLEFLQTWNPSQCISSPVGKLLFLHGSPREPTSGYIYPDTDLSSFTPDSDFVFMGHSHYPFVRKYENTTYINVGSCGLPRDDGRYGAAALFNQNTAEVKIVRFDITEATVLTLLDSPPVHRSVSELFQRRRVQVFGEIFEN